MFFRNKKQETFEKSTFIEVDAKQLYDFCNNSIKIFKVGWRITIEEDIINTMVNISLMAINTGQEKVLLSSNHCCQLELLGFEQ